MYDWKELQKYSLPLFAHISYRNQKYVNVPMSFDIETSSFYLKDGNSVTESDFKKAVEQNPKCEGEYQKASLCYIWQFAIGLDYVFYGRDLCDFTEFLRILADKLDGKRAVIFVHNLSYEFQFIRKYFDWQGVFAIDNRKVMYAKTGAFDFRCSYMLSSKSLGAVSKEIKNEYPEIAKKEGDLDYGLIRHSATPLTDKELSYCEYDVLTVNAYIYTQMKIYGNVCKLPYTNTGRVRRVCRKNCFREKNYVPFIQRLALTPLEFRMARFAFNGGYVHCNPLYVNEVCEQVASYDFTSSYPYVMISEQFPMGRGLAYPKDKITLEVFEKECEKFLAMAAVSFTGIKVKEGLQAIISSSKCLKLENAQYDNGKVWQASVLKMVVTNIELDNIIRFYDYEKLEIGQAYFYKKGYLPKPYIETILDLYKAKTQLKDLKGNDDNETQEIEREYMLKKNMLNSLYGMMVYNPMKDEYLYTDKWTEKKVKIDDESIKALNNDKQRFTFYLWGVFVTSYARSNLFSAILEAKEDFVYSDTDSVKLFNRERHLEYFENYDKGVIDKLYRMCEYYNIDYNECKPKNVKGKEKLLGVWDYEGDYDKFKSLGAKRYLTEINGETSLTVSGVNARKAIPYLKDKYGSNENIFKAFNHNLYIPCEHTGKSIHTYIDDEIAGSVKDYKGNVKDFNALSGIHLSESDYSLSLLEDFRNFFKYIKQVHC